VILAGPYPGLDNVNTENNSEMKQEAEERDLHRMAQVHDFLALCQGSQNEPVSQKDCHTKNK
jgi:hypothetical protein